MHTSKKNGKTEREKKTKIERNGCLEKEKRERKIEVKGRDRKKKKRETIRNDKKLEI